LGRGFNFWDTPVKFASLVFFEELNRAGRLNGFSRIKYF
jgi:hypothetical protein